MSAICEFTCGGAAAVPTSYGDLCDPVTREYGFFYIAFMACDDAAIAGAQCSPCGKVTINSPSFDQVEIGCGVKLPGVYTYTVDFETYLVDENDAEHVYYKTLVDEQANLRVIFLDKTGLAIIDEGAHPGFKFNFSSPPFWVEGDGGLGKYTMQLSVETTTAMIPQPVAGADALCGAAA